MLCSVCTAEVPDDDLFCDHCGRRLAASPAVEGGCTCGAGVDDVDEDGFCLGCGRRLRRPASDHVEEAISAGFAAVSDRGLRHERNEDRFALVEEERGRALVVCDGVSSTRHSEVAAAAVAETVAAVLAEALRGGAEEDAAGLLTRAIGAAAGRLAAGGTEEFGDQTASTTVVAALVVGEEVTVAWAGDSRAYWLEEQGAVALTEDHSWWQRAVTEGGMGEEEAMRSPQAHAITRWVGADADPETEPAVVRHRVGAVGVGAAGVGAAGVGADGGMLLLCTDGLWNYLSPERDLLGLVREAQADGADALGMARALVAFANGQGGRDNVTVALLQVPAAAGASDPAEE